MLNLLQTTHKLGSVGLIAIVLWGCQEKAEPEPVVPKPQTPQQRNITILRQTRSCPACDLRAVDLPEAILGGANLEGAELSEANLNATYLGGANLARADLRGASLINATVWEGANLTAANLQGANLKFANFGGSILNNADLSRTNLLRTNFVEADLTGANLDEAKELEEAIFCETTMPDGSLRNDDCDFTDGYKRRVLQPHPDLLEQNQN